MGSKLTSEGTEFKYGQLLARKIWDRIRATGWVVGQRIGSLESLTLEHGVSLAIMRESVRQLEVSGIVTMRRGREGGLFVRLGPTKVAGHALATHLIISGVDAAHVFDVIFEPLIEWQLTALARDIKSHHVADLRNLMIEISKANSPPIERLDGFMDMIAALFRIADNPILEMVAVASFRIGAIAMTMTGHGQEEYAPSYGTYWKEAVEHVIGDNPLAAAAVLRPIHRNLIDRLYAEGCGR